MVDLKQRPTLYEIQQYVAEMERQRGFSHQNVAEKCLFLGEEIGEIFKAGRKAENLGVDPNSKVTFIGNELADTLIMLCCVWK